MTALLAARGPAAPPPPPRCPVEEQQVWHAGVQAAPTGPVALQGMCNEGSGHVGGPGRAWTEHGSIAGSRGSRSAAAAATPPPQELLLCHAGVQAAPAGPLALQGMCNDGTGQVAAVLVVCCSKALHRSGGLPCTSMSALALLSACGRLAASAQHLILAPPLPQQVWPLSRSHVALVSP